jgi:hypothetical protein
VKLAKLPDRNPVRLTISVMPELNAALNAYAQAYQAAYGEPAAVADLIPFMLEGYLESDRDFAKARKSHPGSGAPDAAQARGASKAMAGKGAS